MPLTSRTLTVETGEDLRTIAQYVWAHQSFLEIKDTPIPSCSAPPLDFDPQTIRQKTLTDEEYLQRFLPPVQTAQNAQVIGKLCPICYDLYDQGTIKVRQLRCEHVFHQTCVDTWMSKNKDNFTCPYCRMDQYPVETD